MLSDCCLSVCDVNALWPNGCRDQDETWHAGRLGHGQIVLDGDPAPPPQKGGRAPNFQPISVVAIYYVTLLFLFNNEWNGCLSH